MVKITIAVNKCKDPVLVFGEIILMVFKNRKCKFHFIHGI